MSLIESKYESSSSLSWKELLEKSTKEAEREIEKSKLQNEELQKKLFDLKNNNNQLRDQLEKITLWENPYSIAKQENLVLEKIDMLKLHPLAKNGNTIISSRKRKIQELNYKIKKDESLKQEVQDRILETIIELEAWKVIDGKSLKNRILNQELKEKKARLEIDYHNKKIELKIKKTETIIKELQLEHTEIKKQEQEKETRKEQREIHFKSFLCDVKSNNCKINRDGNGWIPSTSFYENYIIWANEKNVCPVNQTAWGRGN